MQSYQEQFGHNIGLSTLIERIGNWRRKREFYTPQSINSSRSNDGDMMLGKLMLVVSEIAEASEAVRHNDVENFKEELADAVIRIFDISDSMKFDILAEVLKKMDKNELRPIKHGKLTTL